MPLVDLTQRSSFDDNYDLDVTGRYYGRQGQLVPVGAPKIRAGFIRFTMIEKMRKRAEGLVSSLGLADGQKIILLGDTFGWIQENMDNLIVADIVSVDKHQWVHQVKDQDEASEITAALDRAGVINPAERSTWLSRLNQGSRAKRPVLNEDVATNSGKRSVQKELGLTGQQKADWFITCNALAWLDDSECISLSQAGHDLANNVAHVVSPFFPLRPQKKLWNWKHLNSLAPTTPELEAQSWYTTTSWKDLLPNDLFVTVSKFEVI